MSRYTNLFVFVFLGLILYLVGYSQLNALPLFGEDWQMATYLFHDNISDAIANWWRESGEILNFRMLAVIMPIIWFYSFKYIGIYGIIIFNYLVFLSLAYLFYSLMSKVLSKEATLFSTVFFALYPTNTSYLWQATLTYALALCVVFLASIFFRKQKYLLSLIFLMVSTLINEAVFFIFLISLLPTDHSFSMVDFKLKIKRWLLIVVPSGIFYILLRFMIELYGITGGNRVAEAIARFNFIEYGIQFVKSSLVVLVLSFVTTLWKMYHVVNVSDLMIGVLIFFILFVLGSQLRKQNSDVKHSSSIVCCLGFLLILGGRYYGFFYVPSMNVLSLDSRYYFAASVGGAVFFGGIFQYLFSRFSNSYRSIIFAGCLTAGCLAVFRYEIQRDYVLALDQAQTFWREMIPKLDSLPEESFLCVNLPKRTSKEIFGKPIRQLSFFDIVNIPENPLGKPVGISEAIGDLRWLVPRLGNRKQIVTTGNYVHVLNFDKESIDLEFLSYANPTFERMNRKKDQTYLFEWQNGQLIQSFGNHLETKVIDANLSDTLSLLQVFANNNQRAFNK